ncbi:cytochrome P450 4V2-like, partial [Centruroides sculpturatus]|uniref:cytochrome P450 4V2-like n=1 Tax=Centruroides sculpturatus TaxID=218467 RepID=UPI000C6DEC00
TFRIIEELVSLFKDHGMIQYRFGKLASYVMLFHHKTVQPILENGNNINKAGFYNFFKPWLGSGLLLNSGEKWRKRRKLLTPAFHFCILENFLPIMDEQSRLLVERLEQCREEEWIDIVPYIAQCALNTICETAMGIPAKTHISRGSHYFESMKMCYKREDGGEVGIHDLPYAGVILVGMEYLE